MASACWRGGARAWVNCPIFAPDGDNRTVTVDDLVASGLAALSAGRWDQARDAFEAALATDPTDGVALDGLGEALWWRGEPGRSLEL
jgi:Flp pilus assembly protein TadD